MASAVDQLTHQRPTVQARPVPWVALAWFGVLLIAAYFPIVKHLVEQWSGDEDVGHGSRGPTLGRSASLTKRAAGRASLTWPPEVSTRKVVQPSGEAP